MAGRSTAGACAEVTFRPDYLTADTFVRAWIARGRIQQVTVRAYLLTIARNLHRDHVQRERVDGTAAVPDVVDSRPAVDVQVHHALVLERVRRHLGRLARGDRQALVMFIDRGMSHREIAGALGVSVGAVKSRIFRAREALLIPERRLT